MAQSTYKNVCTRLLHKKEDGTEVRQAKKAYPTLDKAIEVAKHLNETGSQQHKVVAYKCNTCFQYHVGKNNSPRHRVRNYTTIDDIKKLNMYRNQ